MATVSGRSIQHRRKVQVREDKTFGVGEMICSQCGREFALGMTYYKKDYCHPCAVNKGIWPTPNYNYLKQKADKDSMIEASKLRRH